MTVHTPALSLGHNMMAWALLLLWTLCPRMFTHLPCSCVTTWQPGHACLQTCHVLTTPYSGLCTPVCLPCPRITTYSGHPVCMLAVCRHCHLVAWDIHAHICPSPVCLVLVAPRSGLGLHICSVAAIPYTDLVSIVCMLAMSQYCHVAARCAFLHVCHVSGLSCGSWAYLFPCLLYFRAIKWVTLVCLFACLPGPRTASWWLGHEHACAHVCHIVVLHHGGLGMPVHIPFLFQDCKLVNCWYACSCTLCVSALLTAGPGAPFICLHCFSATAWHHGRVCSHACRIFVPPLANLGLPAPVLAMSQFSLVAERAGWFVCLLRPYLVACPRLPPHCCVLAWACL